MKESLILNLFVGFILKNGKRSKAETIVMSVLHELKNHFREDPFYVLSNIVDNVRPRLELRPRVIAGTVYKIPSLMKEGLDYRLAIKWIVSSAAQRPGKNMSIKLFNELLDTYSGSSASIRKRDELHKLVLSSRPLLKYLK
jgi:small subunit ribosomal protein S7